MLAVLVEIRQWIQAVTQIAQEVDRENGWYAHAQSFDMTHNRKYRVSCPKGITQNRFRDKYTRKQKKINEIELILSL